MHLLPVRAGRAPSDVRGAPGPLPTLCWGHSEFRRDGVRADAMPVQRRNQYARAHAAPVVSAPARETDADGVRRRLLRQPRTVLALTAAIVGVGVFSSSIGSGALPTDSLP